MTFGKFWKSTGGNFAMMLSIALVPIIMGVGFGIDYSRMLRARSHLQDVADAASLSLAASKLEDDAKIEDQAQHFVDANFDANVLDSVKVESVTHDDDNYDVTLKGEVPAYFMSIANINDLAVRVSSLAVRGVSGSVEVALVLDNTDSMNQSDASGVSKISALKSAAGALVTALHKEKDAVVRIGLVPYADYVNVGLSHRKDSWMSVADDYTTGTAQTCQTSTTKSVCTAWAPKSTCDSTRDGVVVSVPCGGGCTASEVKTVDPYQTCSGGYTQHKWYGCVASRAESLHLTDASPSTPYPGLIDTRQTCPSSPVLPLTADEAVVQDAISAMSAGVPGYLLKTYIPDGLVWGLNVLSPKAPFSEGKTYDTNNKDPRKVIVLMTDGENTLRYDAASGKHPDMTQVGTSADHLAVYDTTQAAATRDDTLAICQNVKDDKIEIFSVAFAVDSADSKSLLQSCATDSEHYFDATDSTALKLAFSQIAEALRQVRLAR